MRRGQAGTNKQGCSLPTARTVATVLAEEGAQACEERPRSQHHCEQRFPSSKAAFEAIACSHKANSAAHRKLSSFFFLSLFWSLVIYTALLVHYHISQQTPKQTPKWGGHLNGRYTIFYSILQEPSGLHGDFTLTRRGTASSPCGCAGVRACRRTIPGQAHRRSAHDGVEISARSILAFWLLRAPWTRRAARLGYALLLDSHRRKRRHIRRANVRYSTSG